MQTHQKPLIQLLSFHCIFNVPLCQKLVLSSFILLSFHCLSFTADVFFLLHFFLSVSLLCLSSLLVSACLLACYGFTDQRLRLKQQQQTLRKGKLKKRWRLITFSKPVWLALFCIEEHNELENMIA